MRVEKNLSKQSWMIQRARCVTTIHDKSSSISSRRYNQIRALNTVHACVCVYVGCDSVLVWCMWSRLSSKGIKHITSVSFGSFAHFVEATKHWQIFVLVVYGCPAKSVLFIHLFCIDIAINFADSSGVEWILFMCASVYSCPFYSIQMW